MSKLKWIDLSRAILLGFVTVGVLLIALLIAENTMSEQLDPNAKYEGLEGSMISANRPTLFKLKEPTFKVYGMMFTLRGEQGRDMWEDRKAFAVASLMGHRINIGQSTEVFPIFLEIHIPNTNMTFNVTYNSYKEFPENNDCIDDEERYCFVKYEKDFLEYIVLDDGRIIDPYDFSLNESKAQGSK